MKIVPPPNFHTIFDLLFSGPYGDVTMFKLCLGIENISWDLCGDTCRCWIESSLTGYLHMVLTKKPKLSQGQCAVKYELEIEGEWARYVIEMTYVSGFKDITRYCNKFRTAIVNCTKCDPYLFQ